MATLKLNQEWDHLTAPGGNPLTLNLLVMGAGRKPPTLVRLSCRDQDGRRGSEEAVPGPSEFPSGEPVVSGVDAFSVL